MTSLLSSPDSRSRIGLLLILTLYLVLSVQFMQATPEFEASDEATHFGHVLHLKENKMLIVADANRRTLAAQEATQPPLYYVLTAIVINTLNTADKYIMYLGRANAPVGRADIAGYKHGFIHSEHRQAPALTALAVKTARYFSMALGLVTIICTFLTFRTLFPSQSSSVLFATSLVAFNPMFLFISNSVNNDTLLMSLCSAVTFLAVRLSKNQISLLGTFILGIILGLAVLTKVSALVMLPGLMALLLFSQTNTSLRVKHITMLLTVLACTCTWWFCRNYVLYGDLLGHSVHVALAGNARHSVELLALAYEWDGFVKSYWGVFGLFNVIFSDQIYYGFYILTALGCTLIASLFFLVRDHNKAVLYFLTLVFLSNLGAVAIWTSDLYGSQGRLMFPSITAFAVLFAWGLSYWPESIGRATKYTISVLLLSASTYASLWVIPAQYPS